MQGEPIRLCDILVISNQKERKSFTLQTIFFN